MTPTGDPVLWDVKEVFMPLTGVQFFATKIGCITRLVQNLCHGLTWNSRDKENVWSFLQAFKAFMGFCMNLDGARILLKWNQAETDRLRSWFKVVDSTFNLPLYSSADWH